MPSRITGALLLAMLLAGAAIAATPSWIEEFIMVRAPQTKVVRHPVDRGKYYLCWQEGTSRYGLAFRKSNLDDKLRAIRPGGSASLSTMMPVSQGSWTAEDEKMCWGG